MAEPGEVFDVDAYIAEAKLVPLKVKIGRKTVELPHFSLLSLDQAASLEAGDAETLRRSLVTICGEQEAKALAALPGVGLNAVLERWMAQAQSEPGEDKASSSS